MLFDPKCLLLTLTNSPPSLPPSLPSSSCPPSIPSSGEFSGVMTEENFGALDKMAKDVAHMVDSAETNLGPVSGWTDGFKW